MAKSNKTLLCCLLTCVMVLACVLTILPIATPTTANAETTEKFVKVTEAPTDDDWSGIYLIVYEAGSVCFDGSLTTLDATNNNQTVAIVDGEIDATLTKPYSFTISKTDNGYSILSKSGYYIGQSSDANGLGVTESNSYSNSFSLSTDGSTNIKSGGAYLRYNASSGQTRFRFFKSATYSNQKAIALYKLTEISSHTHDNWKEEVIEAATCTKEGKIKRTCQEEGCSVVEEVTVPALGHTWGDVVATTPATCTAEGVGSATCTVCGESDTSIVIPKLDHDYSGANGTCVNGCGYTKDENLVLEAYDLAVNATIKNATLTGTITKIDTAYSSQYKNITVTIAVGNLENKTIQCYRLAGGSELKVGDKITVVGTLKNNGGKIRFEAAATYQLIKESLVINEKIAAGTGTTETNGKLYIKKGSKVVITYSIDTNTGINGLGGTFNYNKNFFAINDRANDIVVSNIFGTTVQLTGTETTAEAIKFLFVGKDGEENFNGNAVGDFISVTYTVIADITAADLAEVAFGLVDVQAVKEGNVALTDTELVVNNLADYNLAVTNKTTITVDGKESGATIKRTYDGTTFSVGTTESDTYKLVSNRTDEPTITWTLGGEPATELKNAGTYTLTIEYEATAEYQAATATYTIVVKQVEIASTNIAITNNTTSKDLLGGNAKWTEADFTITYNGETLPDEFSGLYQIAIVNGEVAEAVAQHTLTVELTLTAQASVNYVLTGTDVAEGKLSKQFVVSVVNAAINIIGMPDNVERAYNAQAIDLSGVSVEDGATLKIYVALNGGAEVEVTENLDTYVKNVGSYVVRFEAHKNANVYSQTRTYAITKCDLAKVELVYNGDTVTWTDTQTNGETVVVKYTIAATEITNHAYTATQKNTEEVKLVVSTDNANYNGYELTLANVYAVTFSYLATHDAETNTAIVKYVFDGQHAASIELPTETGYTFSGWYLLDNETVAENVFDFATTEIKNDITLTGKWTVNTYTVTFKLGNGQDDVTVSVNYGEKIADKIPADPTKAADDYIYTFKYWTLSTDETKAEVNVAEYVVSGDVTFVAEYDQTKNEFTVTLVIKYNDETITTETRVGKLGQTIELPSGIQSKVLKLGKWLYEDETEFDGKITKTATVTATYEIILEKGDVNGDGKVNLDDVVLFRKYLVGGYAIDEIADEDIYTAISAQDAASKTMFFKYSANLDNDANIDIRDVATIRMNVVVTTEGGEEQTQTTQSAARMEVVSEEVQYAVLPTNKFVA